MPESKIYSLITYLFVTLVLHRKFTMSDTCYKSEYEEMSK